MKASQEKQVRVLKTNIKLWNRYIRFCLSINVEFFADLRSADLRFADLSSANLDMSCLPLWCGSLKTKFDLKLRVQIGFHFASLIQNGIDVTDEEKQIYNSILEYVNKFHRTDVERLKPIE